MKGKHAMQYEDLPDTADLNDQSCTYPGCRAGTVWNDQAGSYFPCPDCNPRGSKGRGRSRMFIDTRFQAYKGLTEDLTLDLMRQGT